MTCDITTLNKNSFIKFMHMAVSVRETCVTYRNSTARLIEN